MENKLKCNAGSCVYNYNQLCSANEIKVQGPNTHDGDNTFCGTYENRGAGSFVSSIGNTNFSGALSEVTGGENSMAPSVSCSAHHCTYNQEEKCQASAVQILGFNSDSAKGTECQTFHPEN